MVYDMCQEFKHSEIKIWLLELYAGIHPPNGSEFSSAREVWSDWIRRLYQYKKSS